MFCIVLLFLLYNLYTANAVHNTYAYRIVGWEQDIFHLFSCSL